LACYDELVESLSIVKLDKRMDRQDRPPVEVATAESKLGLERVLSQNKVKSNAAITMQLVSAKKDRKNRWIFEFSNKQVWKQVEPLFLPKPPNFPAKVQISPGVFGSYDLRSSFYSKKVKVKRTK